MQKKKKRGNPIKIKNMWKLLELLCTDKLLKISEKYNVDHKVKKLPGHVVFLCIVTTMLTRRSTTLRELVWAFQKSKFQKRILKYTKDQTISHSAFHYRLKKIPAGYFEECNKLVAKVLKGLPKGQFEKFDILIVDSTINTESEKVLETGYPAKGKGNKNQVKYTVGFNSFIPVLVNCYVKSKYNSENTALRKTILGAQIGKNVIVIFDRGLQDRKTYDKFIKKGIRFVGRLNEGCRLKVEKKLPIQEGSNVTKHVSGFLFNGKNEKTEHCVRIIEIKVLSKTGKENKIMFVTNIPEDEVSAEEIAELYKRRWEIEVFFRFIKQNLGFSHFLCRSENGLKSMGYLAMISAILLLVYKKLNNIQSDKKAKKDITEELLDIPKTFQSSLSPPFF